MWGWEGVLWSWRRVTTGVGRALLGGGVDWYPGGWEFASLSAVSGAVRWRGLAIVGYPESSLPEGTYCGLEST